LIPQHRDRESPLKVFIGPEIQLANVFRAIVLIGTIRELPTLAVYESNRLDERNNVLEALQRTDDDCAVRPWTPVMHVEYISALFCGELGVGIRGDEVAKAGNLPTEVPVFVCDSSHVGAGQVGRLLMGKSGASILPMTSNGRVTFSALTPFVSAMLKL